MPLLPDPEPRPRRFPIISVDDHLIEPPDLFEGRMPPQYVDVAPRVVDDDGRQQWLFEGNLYPNIGLNAVVGRPSDDWSMDAARFDEMRKGCWDIHARIADMDLAGIWASVCFPSLLAGFAGTVFSRAADQGLGLACVRAWNDWHHDVWAGTYPERIIWASDYPHPDAKFPGVTDELAEAIAPLSEDQQHRIAGQNAVELYGLG